jgi:hypothetical protein
MSRRDDDHDESEYGACGLLNGIICCSIATPLFSTTMPSFSFLLLLLACWMMSSSTADLLEECRSKGFNPHQLSCDTCNILKDTVHLENCQYCCQAYKDTKNTATRYGAAVLLHSPGSDEMDNFVKDDLPTMEKRGQIIVKEQQQKAGGFGQDDLRMMMMGFMGSQPSSILWLDEKPTSSSATVDALRKIAKEEIDLRGWKRDDIKSMLQTLLA